jgi:hypothetical protein
LNAGNQGIILIFAVLLLIKYVQALKVASAQLSVGKSQMLESLLVGFFLTWFFPLMSNGRLSITMRGLKHLPLTLRDLFVIRVATLFIPPVSWMILAASIAMAYPLAHATNPVAGIVALGLFMLFSWLTGLTVSHLISLPVWRKILLITFAVMTVAIATYFLRSERVAVSFLPVQAVARAAFGEAVFPTVVVLSALTAFAAVGAIWSFRTTVEADDESRSRTRRPLVPFFGLIGGLSAKDFRYYRRLLDPYCGLLASAIGCVYFVIADVASPEVFWIFVIIVFFPNASLTFNAFGLDNRSAMARYSLLPLSGKEIVLSKNQAYLAMLGVELAPLFLFAVWRLGIVVALLGIIEAILLALAYLTWGNMIAVTHRFSMQFYRFSSGGSPIDALVGVIFGTLPGAIAIKLFQERLWWVSGLLFIYGAMYWGSMIWSGRRLEQRGLEVS